MKIDALTLVGLVVASAITVAALYLHSMSSLEHAVRKGALQARMEISR